MSKHRRAANVDKNQQDVVKELRQRGIAAETGHDDILVGRNGKTYWFELKAEDAVSKRTGMVRHSEIKESQKKLACTWPGHYRIVWTVQQIIDEVLHNKVDPMTVIDPATLYRWRVENGW